MGDRSNRPVRVLAGPSEDGGARVRRVNGLTFWAETLYLETLQSPEFIDVTDQVAAVVGRSSVSQGWVSVFSRHTTAAVVINENEPLLLKDMSRLLGRLSSADDSYAHNDMSLRTGEMEADECANGHAHCQHLLIGGSENIPIAEGKMELGRWQRIFLLELDRPRSRQLVVQVFGA